MYAVHAVRHTITADGICSEQVPTFYLDESVQGIVDSEHAERIARTILPEQDTCNGTRDGVRYSIRAYSVLHPRNQRSI